MSKSTSEAELVAMDTTLRVLALPMVMILNDAVGVSRAEMCGGNQSLLQIRKAGLSPAMRRVARMHRVFVAWLSVIYHRENLSFQYTGSEHMAVDMLTNGL